MRGSLMVHLRVAHYGFSSVDRSRDDGDKSAEGVAENEISEDKPASLERNDNKQWQCDVCRKCFTTKYFLKKHKRLHTGETPYACTQCNKTFTFQQSYHKHLLYHNDEKPHVCNYCGRAFKELSTLHNHQRIHTGEKPFSCETCGKCFRQRVSYLVHRRIHTGAMPYKCTACEKSFRYKVSQRTHKCLAQPPGTVVRQTGDLVEKLKKIHDSDVTSTTDESETLVPGNSSTNNQEQPPATEVNQIAYPEISEANAELVRRGASLSLEDMVSDNFSFIAEAFMENHGDQIPCVSYAQDSTVNSNEVYPLKDTFPPNVEELMDSIPNEEKNVPSPSDILKNLCLSKDDDSIEILNNLEEEKLFDAKNIDMFL
ncbi:zinc-finger double domain-containing protein [Phthorimaea operculella]|nr:zinc-finger double domain-containing protein [Phthorimaea operculella]